MSNQDPIVWKDGQAFIGDKLVAVVAISYYGLRVGLWHGEDQKMGWHNAKIINLDEIRAAGELEEIPSDANLEP